MTIWKKAVSSLATAGLLASLLATAFAPSAFAAIGITTVTTDTVYQGQAVTLSNITITSSNPSTDFPTTAQTVVLAPSTGYTFTTAGTTTTTAVGCTFANTISGGKLVITQTNACTSTTASSLVVSGTQVTTALGTTSGSITIDGSSTNALAAAAAGTVVRNFSSPTVMGVTPTPATGVPADGISTVALALTAVAASSYGSNNIVITTSAGKFQLGTATGLTIDATGTKAQTTVGGAIGAGTLVLVAPTTPGTATVTVYLQPTGGGIATTDSTTSVTFYAAGTSPVSTATSTNVLSATSQAAALGTTGSTLVTTVKDAAGNNLPTATLSITYTISPIGTLTSGTTGQTITVSGANPVTVTINSTGVAGPSTIKTTVTYNGISTVLPAKTFTFFGPLASITLSNLKYSLGLGTTGTGALSAVAKDAGGNVIAAALAAPVTLPSPVTGISFGAQAADGSYPVNVTCSATTAGTASIAVHSGLVTSNAVSITCAGVASSFTISSAASTVAVNGTVAVTVDVKDAGGFPVADGTNVTAVTNGVGVVVSTTGSINTATTSNGKASFTYIAPSNAGSAVVTAFVGGVAGSQSVTLTIGTPTPPPAPTGSAASALGVTTSGSFTTATKTPAIGTYVTVKFSFGAAAAGSTITIQTATKSASGVWSAFTNKTTRIANANGDVYFYWKSSSAAWLSIRAVGTNAVQVRWM